jgi:hypothetical protein
MAGMLYFKDCRTLDRKEGIMTINPRITINPGITITPQKMFLGRAALAEARVDGVEGIRITASGRSSPFINDKYNVLIDAREFVAREQGTEKMSEQKARENGVIFGTAGSLGDVIYRLANFAKPGSERSVLHEMASLAAEAIGAVAQTIHRDPTIDGVGGFKLAYWGFI